MTATAIDLTAFIERWVATPFLTYVHVDSPAGKAGVNRAFDLLFSELMRRRNGTGDSEITSA
jgi:hypothetical protein